MCAQLDALCDVGIASSVRKGFIEGSTIQGQVNELSIHDAASSAWVQNEKSDLVSGDAQGPINMSRHDGARLCERN